MAPAANRLETSVGVTTRAAQKRPSPARHGFPSAFAVGFFPCLPVECPVRWRQPERGCPCPPSSIARPAVPGFVSRTASSTPAGRSPGTMTGERRLCARAGSRTTCRWPGGPAARALRARSPAGGPVANRRRRVGPQRVVDFGLRASVARTPLFPVPGNAISNDPGVPLSR